MFQSSKFDLLNSDNETYIDGNIKLVLFQSSKFDLLNSDKNLATLINLGIRSCFNQASSTYSILTWATMFLDAMTDFKFQSSKFDLLNSDHDFKSTSTYTYVKFQSSKFDLLNSDMVKHTGTTQVFILVSIKQVRLTQF